MENVTFWRLVKERYALTAFDGYGARTFGGRWNSPGHECVYLGESKALCVLETLVHLEIEDIALGYCFLTLDVPRNLIATLDLTALPADWKADPPPVSTQQIGDDWLASTQNGLILRVPSTITGEWNALFNPEHPQAAKVLKSVKSEPFMLDPRLSRAC
ncbi:RES domain-containing protein [Phytobacter palmae]|uniref:RES family NAD+ phosphorylase n=1 Tax=Phytobacter palmae TaxID=1855371 RepID=A0ABU9V456_9ENTR|nr:RES family NAD+ phosphorylase [Escherichia coli]SFE42698.1 RES domain-containing protein [Phytobacter palmae]